MIISIYTQIAPRLETFFLEEWIDHNLMIGVDKIYLYDNGFISDDVKYGTGVVWGKKPYRNHFFEYSDKEIEAELSKIVKKFNGRVSLTEWHFDGSCPPIGPNNDLVDLIGRRPHTHCQTIGYKHCVENNHSDVWIHIDPDEYILPKKNSDLKEFICGLDTKKYFAFVMSQKLFEERISGKCVRQLKRCQSGIKNSEVSGNTKTIFVGIPKKFYIHRPEPKNGIFKFINPNDLRYNHYSGAQDVPGSTREEFEKESKIVLNSTDDSMIQFLKKHGVNLENDRC